MVGHRVPAYHGYCHRARVGVRAFKVRVESSTLWQTLIEILFQCLLRFIRGAVDSSVQRIISASLFLHPGFLIIDHIHFQYNGFMFGILLWSILMIRNVSQVKVGFNAEHFTDRQIVGQQAGEWLPLRRIVELQAHIHVSRRKCESFTLVNYCITPLWPAGVFRLPLALILFVSYRRTLAIAVSLISEHCHSRLYCLSRSFSSYGANTPTTQPIVSFYSRA